MKRQATVDRNASCGPRPKLHAVVVLTAVALVSSSRPALAQNVAVSVPPSATNFPIAAPTAHAAPGVASAKARALAGQWQTSTFRPGPITPAGLVAFTPAYEAKRQELERLDQAHAQLEGNEPKCIPNGMPMMMFFGFQIAADGERLTVITSGPRVRWIWLNRGTHTDEDHLFPSYSGESIGHWEGDTLVVDTTGLSRTNEIIYGMSVNDERMHVVERWRLISAEQLEIATTVSDPAALQRPWTYKEVYARQKASDDLVYCIAATDRDAGGGFNLSPPPGGFVPPGARQ